MNDEEYIDGGKYFMSEVDGTTLGDAVNTIRFANERIVHVTNAYDGAMHAYALDETISDAQFLRYVEEEYVHGFSVRWLHDNETYLVQDDEDAT